MQNKQALGAVFFTEFVFLSIWLVLLKIATYRVFFYINIRRIDFCYFNCISENVFLYDLAVAEVVLLW